MYVCNKNRSSFFPQFFLLYLLLMFESNTCQTNSSISQRWKGEEKLGEINHYKVIVVVLYLYINRQIILKMCRFYTNLANN